MNEETETAIKMLKELLRNMDNSWPGTVFVTNRVQDVLDMLTPYEPIPGDIFTTSSGTRYLCTPSGASLCLDGMIQSRTTVPPSERAQPLTLVFREES